MYNLHLIEIQKVINNDKRIFFLACLLSVHDDDFYL